MNDDTFTRLTQTAAEAAMAAHARVEALDHIRGAYVDAEQTALSALEAAVVATGVTTDVR